MATIHDAAAGVLERFDEALPTAKLQALLYLAQGWSLAIRDQALFDEPFHAWSNGPVSPDLFRHHRRQYTVSQWPVGNARALDGEEDIIIDSVVRQYGALSGLQLRDRDFTNGAPWVRARYRASQRPGADPESVASDEPIPSDELQQHFVHLLNLRN